MATKNQVLVVEDEAVIRSALRRLLERHNFEVSEAGTVKESLENFDVDNFDVIISDLRLPGAPGTDLIKATSTPVVIMTSYSSIRSAIDSIQMGAVDYIAKPFEHKELIDTISKVIQEYAFSRSIEQSDTEQDALPIEGMIGSCPHMQELFRRIKKVALTDSTVLINGESGTGKELVARAMHRLSNRQQQEMISVNCAAIPENLIESELFGHEKGAFTGAMATRTGLVEAANSSTLFLDEIGELPLEAQARLLRVLQENEIRKVGSVQSRKVDVRLVAATHRDLKQLVADGHFREDLYYRINVMTLLIPPLRERGEDILELADAILQRTCHRLKTPQLDFTSGASKAIACYHWPGNVRELENAIERAVVLAESNEIGEELLAIDLEARMQVNEQTPDIEIMDASQSAAEELSLEDYFQRFVLKHQHSMNETQLAQKLGISRKCLWERRQRFGIPRKKKQPQ
ncbi:MAG: sigma-54 dependent transcriptional regulator [Gammaproteobacteria bacterium]|nr:sigma-54 dependent transcriptional regulator [Gammaproteobacteria bacterium]MCY4358431.1 sigma-54 dependent transcriptional regulator [Gammaproteobacteria bacterium]